MKNNYSVENEKLCLNGTPTPLIFGDRDQIEAIRKYEEINRKLNEEGADTYPEYEIKFRFNCICGYQLSHEEDIDQYEDVEDYTPFKTCTCNRCNRYYTFENQGCCSEYVVKLLGFKKLTDD